jgi:prolyl-tRNA synthetase
MPTLQPADLWRESGRYDDYGQEMLRIKDRQDREMLYGPTNEEMITDIFRAHVNSYKDLPLTLYHIQWKFRDEMRPRFGVMRGREFLMKDGYNFDVDKASALHAYNRHMVSYLRTYERMGLTAIPMRADSGPIGGDDTHEFLVLASTGESEVFFDSAVTELKLGNREVDYDNREEVADLLFRHQVFRGDGGHGRHRRRVQGSGRDGVARHWCVATSRCDH